MTYPDLFAAYHHLKGSDWIRTIQKEDRQAFAMIGFRESDFGRKGGVALYHKYGHGHMAEMGRRGALVTNLKKWIARRIQEESETLS